jgi:hypothetical protein
MLPFCPPLSKYRSIEAEKEQVDEEGLGKGSEQNESAPRFIGSLSRRTPVEQPSLQDCSAETLEHRENIS